MNNPPPLQLIPKEIEFQENLISDQKSFKLENTSDKDVLYRIKTTAPKRYMVRPNTGHILPRSFVLIKVTMNLSKDPKKDPKSDKFQVQSLYHSSPQQLDEQTVKDIWSTSKSEVFKQRIKAKIVQSGATSNNLDASLTHSTTTFSDSYNNPSLTTSESDFVSQNNIVKDPTYPVEPSVNPVSTYDDQKGQSNTGNNLSVSDIPRNAAIPKQLSTPVVTPIDMNLTEIEQLKREKAQLQRQCQDLRKAKASNFSIERIILLIIALIIGYVLGKSNLI
jgi:hypothetical protein